MIISIKNYIPFYTVVVLLLFLSCKKEYERPDVFKEDVFEDKKKQQQEKTAIDPDLAFEKSDMVILSNQVKLMDSTTKISEMPLYIYQVNEGSFLKQKDSIHLPLVFFSSYNLHTEKTKDSARVYLQNVEDYQIFAQKMNVKYQTVKNAPTFNNSEN